jgi:hypothetical protein
MLAGISWITFILIYIFLFVHMLYIYGNYLLYLPASWAAAEGEQWQRALQFLKETRCPRCAWMISPLGGSKASLIVWGVLSDIKR